MIKRTHLLFFVFFIVSMLFINGFSICKYAFADNGGKSMIIYFTWSGNSEVIAKKIQDKTGGDILKLEPVNPYPNDYHSCVEEWIQERDSGADRELKTVLPNLSRYDIIYLCYPIWSGTIPTPVKTMLKYNDFSGKLIMPVASHGGGGAGRSATDIARLLPQARVGELLSVRGSGGSSLSDTLDRWIRQNGQNR